MAEQARALRWMVEKPRRLRFGIFEVDLRAGELYRKTAKVRLGQQSFQLLAILLENPGEVVLRDEIRARLWPRNTSVEFDHSINAAIGKLRDALGESAESPKYVETLPKRGYRFIGTVEVIEPAPESEPTPPAMPFLAPAPAPPQPTDRRRPTPALWRRLAPAVLAAGAIALAWIKPWQKPAPRQNWTFSLGTGAEPVLSPDGSTGLLNGKLLRRLDGRPDIELNTPDSMIDRPAWSPGGSQIAYVSVRGLVRFPLPAGPPVVLWPAMGITRGLNWGPKGAILAAVYSGNGGRLHLIDATSGRHRPLKMPGLDNGMFYYPEFLPDGKYILFAWENGGDVGIYLAKVEDGIVSRGPFLLRKNPTAGHYSPAAGGRLLFVNDDKLFAQRLNLGRGALEGEPEMIAGPVASVPSIVRPSFSVSQNGVLTWREGRAALAQATWFDRSGNPLDTAGPLAMPGSVQLSPDESRVVMNVAPERRWVVAEAHRPGAFALPPGISPPIWAPGTPDLIYVRAKNENSSIVRRGADGSENELAHLPFAADLQDITSDGKLALFTREQESVRKSLFLLRLYQPLGPANPLKVAEALQGRFSPDGRWMLYRSFEGKGRGFLYAEPVDGGVRTQISSGIAVSAYWRADGKEVLYFSAGAIYSVSVEVTRGQLHPGAPKALFNVRMPEGMTGDVMPLAESRDGSRILFLQAVEQPEPPLTYVMTAWETKLRR